jgi:4-hydroxythreonine-4-phosphate dehydrogenase
MSARLAITMGDPAGIGPEIIARAVDRLGPALAEGRMRAVIIGSWPTYLAACAAQGLANRSELQAEAVFRDDPAPLAFLEAEAAPQAHRPGRATSAGGALAHAAVAMAVGLALEGRVDAICTAPLSKEGLSLAGKPYAGHTELLAELTGAEGPVMMLAHGPIRVSHVTTHLALADVAARVTPGRIARAVELTDAMLRQLGIAAPRIAVAALNPHAGEGGLFGRQDIDVVAPTVASLAARGFAVEGPVPGDTVFVKLRAGRYDAVVAMYHDQGHIPVKLLGFSVDPATGQWRELSGVNVTLGLPVIRTSVDHGTAFDIAGQGIASEQSLIEAIDFALQLAEARDDRGRGA